MPPIIAVDSLTFKYPRDARLALDDFSLAVEPGVRAIVVGRNGAGKSTLLHVLAGKHLVPEDKVNVLGRPAFHDTSLAAEVTFLGGPFRFWAGYVENDLVSVAAALVCDDQVDVAFVATQPHARRRGYGEALTWAATLAEPSLPAVLEASDDGRPVYERMGYRDVGRMTLWERPRDPAHPVYSPYAPPPPS